MSDLEFLQLGLRILDEQLVDAVGRRCGRVEDIEFDHGPGGSANVIGILCGRTAWKRRLPPGMAELIPADPKGLHRVPWDGIAKIENEIELKLPEDQLEPAGGAPGAPLAISQLIAAQTIDLRGEPLGRIREVIAARPAGSLPDTPWSIHSLLIGRRALLQRVGWYREMIEQMERGTLPDNLIRWGWALHFDDLDRLVLGGADRPREAGSRRSTPTARR